MEIDFTKVTVKDLEGRTITLPIDTKKMANEWYFSAGDIKECDIAREIYEKGKVVLTKEKAMLLKAFIQRYFVFVVRESLISQIDAFLEA